MLSEFGMLSSLCFASGLTNCVCVCVCRFSHDRGGCFVERTVDTTGVFQLNRGLVFDPSAASLYGFLMGVEGTSQDDEWRFISLDFKSLLRNPCNV